MDQRLVGPDESNLSVLPELKHERKIAIYIGLFDMGERAIDDLARRVKERYGHHFPELATIVPDSLLYVKTVKLMGARDNAADLRFSEVLPELQEVEAELKEAARTSSSGAEVGEIDLPMAIMTCDQVLSIAESNRLLHDYLRKLMNTAAPNLTALVGELVGARLIARAGGMANLGKMGGRRINRTLGPGRRGAALIYDAPLVKQAAPFEAKRKMARSLAARCASAVSRDLSLSGTGTDKDNFYGLENRAEVGVVSSPVSPYSLFAELPRYPEVRLSNPLVDPGRTPGFGG